MNREQLLTYRTAPWTTSEDFEAFLSLVVEVAVDDVVGMLKSLTDKALSSDAGLHRRRCTAFARLAAEVREKTLFPHYLSALKMPDRQLRAVVAPLLPQVTGATEQAQLCELLRSNDEELRALAVRILKQVGGRVAAGVISSMVAEPDFAGRREALALVVSMSGGQHSIPALAATLRVGRPAEKRQALHYLADPKNVGAGVSSALAAIVEALGDPLEAVVIDAIAAFAALCTEAQYFDTLARFLDHESPAVVAAAVGGLQRFDSPRAVQVLERKLLDGPTSVRLAVLGAMEGMGTDSIVPGLVEALGHRDLTVRTRAAEVLSRLSQGGRIDISRTLVYLLRTGDVDLRRMAADLARSVTDGKAELWPKLVHFLRDEDWWVRERVVDALIELAGRELTPLLSEFVSDPSDVVRRFAVEVLARLHDPDAAGLLVRTAMLDADWWVRERAIEALAAFRDPSVAPDIVKVMQSVPGTELVSLQALRDLGAPEVAPAVAELLDSDDPDVRLKALECLDGLHAVDEAPRVELLIGDPNAAVRLAARDLLGRWKIAGRPVAAGGALSSLDGLLVLCAEQGADDLVLSPGRPPYLKKLGRMNPVKGMRMSPNGVEMLLAPHLSAIQMADLKALREVDLSYEVKARGLRFRANVFRQLGGMAAVFRIVASEVPHLERLGLPPVVASFAGYRDGLVLVGGPTGSGKSTTLAAIIDMINRDTTRHVISIEDPIEFVYPRRKALINQREVGTHLRSTSTALRSMLRQDPDVLVVGEMRDLPTISFAVTAAETGHLVFGTVHTASADTTIDRIMNAFPAAARDQVRSMLADSLRAILCQHLIPRRDGTGRVLAAEVLINNEAVAHLLRKGKAYQIPAVVATAREAGMQAMDVELRRLMREGVITAEEAYMRATSKKDFEQADLLPAAPTVPLAKSPAGR